MKENNMTENKITICLGFENMVDDAKLILSKLGSNDDDEIIRLAENMQKLESHNSNLGNINFRLKSMSKPIQILETLAEHNFAIELLEYRSDISIEYEPKNLKKRPEFFLKLGDVTYYLEVKKPGMLGDESRYFKLSKKIKKEIEKIQIPKCVNCFLLIISEFEKVEKNIKLIISELIIFILEKVQIDGNHTFIDKNKLLKVELQFFTVDNLQSNLHVFSTGPLGVRTDEIAQYSLHLEDTLKNANKFRETKFENSINLIVIELNSFDGMDDASLYNAVCGTEYITGIFNDKDFSNISGVLMRARLDNSKIICSDYRQILCVNQKNACNIENIKNILRLDKVFIKDVLSQS